MRLSTLLPLIATQALAVFGHPGHTDELSIRQLRALAKRQDDLLKCRSVLQAGHEPRMGRVHAKRAMVRAEKEKGTHKSPSPNNKDHMTARPPPPQSRSLPCNTTTTSTSTSTSTLVSTDTSQSLSFSGSGAPPNGTLGGGGSVGTGTTRTPTATAGTPVLSTFPSTTSGAVPASETTQVSDGACALSPSQEEGPYYIPGEAIRSNLIEGQEGIPLYLEFTLIDTNTCEPLTNAAIDIWSCNATGEYGGFISTDTNDYDTSLYNGLITHLGDTNDQGSVIRDTQTVLRGQQITDGEGIVEFATLVPGWYSGRTGHIHMRVHVGGEITANGTYIGGNITHTGQAFFGEDLYSQVPYIYPYSLDTNVRTTNSEDAVWTQQNGSYGALNMYYVEDQDITQGIIAFLNLAVDSTASVTSEI